MAKQERVKSWEFKVTGYKKYLFMLEMFSFMEPLNSLSTREKQVLANIAFIYNKYELLPEKVRNRLIFDYDTRETIANTLGISKQAVYNLFLSLRKKKFLGEDTVNSKILPLNLDKLIILFNE